MEYRRRLQYGGRTLRNCCRVTAGFREELIKYATILPKKEGAPKRSLRIDSDFRADQRLENWNDRRALARPYFLRSTTRLSRVRKPPRLSTLRSSGSKLVNALDRPWRTAPAWPDRPPPET